MGRLVMLLVISALVQILPVSSQTLLQAVAQANNDFGWDLLNQLTKNEVKNTFISPFNIHTLLGMVNLGAAGGTKHEMERVLHVTEHLNNPDMLAPGHMRLLKYFKRGKKANDTFSAVNNVFPAKGFDLRQLYMRRVKNNYFVAPQQPLDFNNSSEAAKTINQWVETNTNNKIKDLFSPDAFDNDTKLVLTSAIYFKGSWKKKFRTKDTRKERFRLNRNASKEVDMMCMFKCRFPYFHDRLLGIKIIELPYIEKQISMIIILPDDVEGLNNKTFREMIPENMERLSNSMVRRHMEMLKIPKFRMEAKYDNLKQDLIDLQMTSLFSSSADLSRMSRRRDLVVSKVVHQTFVQVDEEGTEATGASGGQIMLLSIGPEMPRFVADHPFIFMLVHKPSSLTLFQGIVTDPPPVPDY